MSCEFVAYIDEAGDEGFKFLDRERGSSRWFVLSATVVRKSNDLTMVEGAREARRILGRPDRYVLHFRDLKHEQRLPLVRLIAGLPIRTVNIMVHKPTIRNPETFQQDAHKLYRYCTRLLMERISWLCRNYSNNQQCRADLVFSNRSAMSYDDLRTYLNRLLVQSATSPDISIDWGAIDPSRVRAVNHDKLAGLQIADAVASSAFFAANRSQYGEIEERYLRMLAPVVFRSRNRIDGYGMKFWCASDEKERLTNLVSLSE
jgi:hypothetical protein